VLAGLSAEQLTTAYLEGEWTAAQNVHHLADSHMNAYIRTRLILLEDQPTLKPYNQEDWAALPDASAADVSASLAILRGLHARWAALFEGLSDADFARAGNHPEVGIITIADLLRTYARHGAAHIDQIQRTLAAQ
jgi:hypothetical protein